MVRMAAMAVPRRLKYNDAAVAAACISVEETGGAGEIAGESADAAAALAALAAGEMDKDNARRIHSMRRIACDMLLLILS